MCFRFITANESENFKNSNLKFGKDSIPSGNIHTLKSVTGQKIHRRLSKLLQLLPENDEHDEETLGIFDQIVLIISNLY